MVESGPRADELAGELVTYPQVLVNVRVRERTPLADVPAVRDAMTSVEDAARTARAGCWCATRAPSRCCAS